MLRCVIVADDLTGGNATGALFAKNGLETYCTSDAFSRNFELSKVCCDVIVYVTDSRNDTSQIAYEKVINCMQFFIDDGILLYNKRIDSTLRGNIAAETEAMLDCLNNDFMAAVVAVYPSTARLVSNGRILVNGQTLDKTSVSNDSFSPVSSSVIEDYFIGKTKYKTGVITLVDYQKGSSFVVDKILNMKNSGIRIIIFDGEKESDLDFIANSLIESNLPYITVDPGPFTMTFAKKIFELKNKHRTLTLIGSTYTQTAEQLKQLINKTDSYVIYMQIDELLQSEEKRRKEIDRAVQSVIACKEKRFAYAIVGDGIFNKRDLRLYADKLNLDVKEVADIITEAFGIAAKEIIASDARFDTIFTCGGDITISVCSKLEVGAIRVIDEIMPLTVLSELADGPFAGIKLISKGGSIGDSESIINSIKYTDKLLF